MFGKGLARCAAACMSAAVLLVFSSAGFLSIGSSTASAEPAVPLTCSPSTATHTFTANNQVWNRSFAKSANGCASIWLVANKTAPFQWYKCGTDGGCAIAPSQNDCGGNTVCQLYDPAPNGSSIIYLEALANAPVTVTVYY